MLYFLAVFAAGFLLGLVRVLILVPLCGELLAVGLELPFMLWISWIASARIAVWMEIPARRADRLLMGGAGLALLLLAEAALSRGIYGLSLAAFLAGLTTPAGALGLTAQIGFALIPWLQSRQPR